MELDFFLLHFSGFAGAPSAAAGSTLRSDLRWGFDRGAAGGFPLPAGLCGSMGCSGGGARSMCSGGPRTALCLPGSFRGKHPHSKCSVTAWEHVGVVWPCRVTRVTLAVPGALASTACPHLGHAAVWRGRWCWWSRAEQRQSCSPVLHRFPSTLPTMLFSSPLSARAHTCRAFGTCTL